ncbi:MAG: hypothetical protein QXO60_00065 [Candidatus Micrarchaeia archaeon]
MNEKYTVSYPRVFLNSKCKLSQRKLDKKRNQLIKHINKIVESRQVSKLKENLKQEIERIFREKNPSDLAMMAQDDIQYIFNWLMIEKLKICEESVVNKRK